MTGGIRRRDGRGARRPRSGGGAWNGPVASGDVRIRVGCCGHFRGSCGPGCHISVTPCGSVCRRGAKPRIPDGMRAAVTTVVGAADLGQGRTGRARVRGRATVRPTPALPSGIPPRSRPAPGRTREAPPTTPPGRPGGSSPGEGRGRGGDRRCPTETVELYVSFAPMTKPLEGPAGLDLRTRSRSTDRRRSSHHSDSNAIRGTPPRGGRRRPDRPAPLDNPQPLGCRF